MSDTPPAGLGSLVGARGNSTSGFEVAHFIANTYWLQRLRTFLSLDRNDPQNLRPLPNRDRGALVFNVTKHARHVDERRADQAGQPGSKRRSMVMSQ